MLGRKVKPTTSQWMLQCEAAGEKQPHVLHPAFHVLSHVLHPTLQPTPVLLSCLDSMGANPEAVDGKQVAPDPVCRSPASHPHQKRSIFQHWHPAPIPLPLLVDVRKKSNLSVNHSQPSQDAVHYCSLPPLPWKPPYFSTRCHRQRRSPQLTVTNDLMGLGPVIF